MGFSLLITRRWGLRLPALSLLQPLVKPAGQRATRPSSSRRSSSEDTCSADSPAREHSESTSTGSCPMCASRPRSRALARRSWWWMRRRSGGSRPSSASTSSADSTSFAPDLMSAWQPLDSGEWIEPGMANTSRPCSAAARAVMSEPDASAASTTRQPRARPLIRRLRRGKLRRRAACRAGNSDTSKAALGDLRCELGVAARIDDVDAGAEDGDGRRPRPQGRRDALRRRCRARARKRS